MTEKMVEMTEKMIEMTYPAFNEINNCKAYRFESIY